MAKAKLVFTLKFLIYVFFRTQFSVSETGTNMTPNCCMRPASVFRKAERGVPTKESKNNHRDVLKQKAVTVLLPTTPPLLDKRCLFPSNTE